MNCRRGGAPTESLRAGLAMTASMQLHPLPCWRQSHTGYEKLMQVNTQTLAYGQRLQGMARGRLSCRGQALYGAASAMTY